MLRRRGDSYGERRRSAGPGKFSLATSGSSLYRETGQARRRCHRRSAPPLLARSSGRRTPHDILRNRSRPVAAPPGRRHAGPRHADDGRGTTSMRLAGQTAKVTRRTKRRSDGPGRRLAAAAVIALLPISACSARTPATSQQPSVTKAVPAMRTPASELRAFYEQRPDWSDCGDGFQCARIQVPLDYTKPSGERIEISAIRLPASGKRAGSLLINPGGPGVRASSTRGPPSPWSASGCASSTTSSASTRAASASRLPSTA